MPSLLSLRGRSAALGLTFSLLALGGAAPPASAAPDTSPSPTTFTFHLSNDNDVTTFLPRCPAATPEPYTFRCGHGLNQPIVQAASDPVKLSSTPMTEFFASALAAPGPGVDCALAIKNLSVVTLHTSRGQVFLITHDGQYCVSTNQDVEPFTIVGGTGDYRGATGSGVINAHATKPQTARQGFAAETYTGTITLRPK